MKNGKLDDPPRLPKPTVKVKVPARVYLQLLREKYSQRPMNFSDRFYK